MGFIGVIAPDTSQSVAKRELMKNGEYLYNFIGSEKKQDLYDCVQRNIDECCSQGADYIIVLGHIGVPNDESEYSANELIAATSGMDVFLMVRNREVGLGDFVADAFRINGNADIALVNGGGVRATIQPGDIKLNDLLNVCPFGNTLCVMEMSGAEILDMLEYGCRFVKKDYAVDGRVCGEYGSFPQVSGMRFTVDTSIESTVEADADGVMLSVGENRRVSDVQVLKDGEYVPLDPEAMYTVASSNYMFKEGGNGMSKILEGRSLFPNELISDIDMLVNYINMLDGDLTQYAQPDGRITIK